MKTIAILTRKDLQLLFLDKTSVIVTFLLPVVLVALVGGAFVQAFPPSVGITSYDYAFSKVMFWGLMGGAASSVASMAIEKNSGTTVRLRLAPLTVFELIAGKAVACVAVILISSLVTWLFAKICFGIMTSAPFALIVVCIANAILFAGLMAFLSGFVHTERSASGLSWAVMQILACFSGIMFPIKVMPPWMQNITEVNPVAWAVKGMENALWKGGEFHILAGLVSATAGAGCFFFALAVLIEYLKRQR